MLFVKFGPKWAGVHHIIGPYSLLKAHVQLYKYTNSIKKWALLNVNIFISLLTLFPFTVVSSPETDTSCSILPGKLILTLILTQIQLTSWFPIHCDFIILAYIYYLLCVYTRLHYLTHFQDLTNSTGIQETKNEITHVCNVTKGNKFVCGVKLFQIAGVWCKLYSSKI